jgi:beta-glucosidase/6-phospho-beta-glucosidase/beta-galactosidase
VTGGLRARFLCGHYSLLAHGKVAKWYHEEFKGKGRISFKNSGNYFAPNTTSKADLDARDRQYEFSLGWFGGPWRDGDYPQVLKDTLGDILPTFTEEEKATIKGSCDFYAIDGYTAYFAAAVPGGSAACAANSSSPYYPECAGSANEGPDGFPTGPASDWNSNWLWSTPVAIRLFLSYLTKELFPTIPDIVVSEFGFSEPFEGDPKTTLDSILWDLRRADYYQGFLDNILAAKAYDGKFTLCFLVTATLLLS